MRYLFLFFAFCLSLTKKPTYIVHLTTIEVFLLSIFLSYTMEYITCFLNGIRNKIEELISYVWNRRHLANGDSRSQADHPERNPPDKLSVVKGTEQKSKSPSTAATTTEVVAVTVTETEATSVIPMTTTTTATEEEPVTTAAITEEEPVTIAAITEEESVTTATTTEGVASSNKCSDFYLACRCNNIEEVKKLLKTLTLDEIDRIEPNGSTALHSASYHGHEEIVKLLLEAGADRAIVNKYNCLPFDEAKNDAIKNIFLRIPNNDRLVSKAGAIEWELINDDVLETAAEERCIIQSLYHHTTTITSIRNIFEKIEKNYINNGLAYFDGIDHIKRFFHKATEEQDPRWIIKAYTAETDFYKVLNKEIACGATQGQKERRYIIALLWHHPKLEELAYIGSCYRVLKINCSDLQKYQVNCLLMTKSFLSSSIDQKIAELFLYRKEAAKDQNKMTVRTKVDGTLIKSWVMCVYHIKHRRTALHIENLSQYANEGEILIMPYTVFKVKRISQIKISYLPNDQTMTEIELEE